MRSRYAAFSMGRGDYLVRTLAQGHPDLELPRPELVLALSRARERQRFLGLRILHARASETSGEVLFQARIFERGKDRSFVELSSFVREVDGWRYEGGQLLPHTALPRDPASLTREAFLALARDAAFTSGGSRSAGELKTDEPMKSER
jgi:SEC-C motif-containing protein